LGDSYFSHIGVMPQRIFPFVVAAEGEIKSHPNMKYTMARKLLNLGKFQRFTAVFAKGFARLQQSLDFDHGMAPDRTLDAKLKKDLTLSTQKMDLHVEKKLAQGAVKSRIKGQRPPSRKRSIPDTVQKARSLKGELREGYKGALTPPVTEVKKDQLARAADAATKVTHQKRSALTEERVPVSLLKNPKLQLNLDLKEIERLQKEKKQRQEQDKSRDRNLDYTP
jgi:hypothetical protein